MARRKSPIDVVEIRGGMVDSSTSRGCPLKFPSMTERMADSLAGREAVIKIP